MVMQWMTFRLNENKYIVPGFGWVIHKVIIIIIILITIIKWPINLAYWVHANNDVGVFF